MAADKLARYQAKRDFAVTSEPAQGGEAGADGLAFVVQKHWASRLHYDFRIELDGVMLSWAVPKGPSLDPKDKRLAAHVEDHPLAYAGFEGNIPAGQYGAGKVIVWDRGSWHPVGDPHAGLQAGNLKFRLDGQKLQGGWALVRMKGRGEKQEPWLLVKEKDAFARSAAECSVVDELPDSVLQPAAQKAPARPARKAAAKPARTPTRSPERAATRTAAPKPAAQRAASAAPAAPHPAAVPAPLPPTLSPQLATLVDAPPGAFADWVFEIKFDGYRLLARIEAAQVRLFTRNGNDWTARLPQLERALQQSGLPDGWYDGEIVVLNDKGVPDFGALQNAFDSARTASIVYFLFDLPFMDGHDLRQVPLEDRRALLQAVLAAMPQAGAKAKAADPLRFSEAFEAPAASIVASACHLGLEGVIGKRRSAVYRATRSADWVKLKCSHRQEFVIGGWTDPKASRTGIGALLLGVFDGGRLRHAGNVGSGFDSKTLASTRKQLDAIAADASPFDPADAIPGRPHWVQPTLVAEVSFGEWTHSGHVRHAVFHGLRLDKDAASIVREKAVAAPRGTAKAQAGTAKPAPARRAAAALPAAASHALSARIKVTHGERIVDASTGITKADVVRYHGLVGTLMQPHLAGRPVSLVRAPAGVGGQLFFQKHAEVEKLPGIAQLDPALDPGHPPLLTVASTEGLLAAAQWNVLELHTQNALGKRYDEPDRIVFDLDPGEGVAWATLQQSAQLVQAFLTELRLVPFLKTSGGKGLHVVVPLKPKAGWDAAKGFSKAVVEHMAATLPQLFVAKSGPKNRVGKVFIDYLRNGRGATTACAWSARARPGMGISVPVGWDELPSLRSGDHWTVRSVHTRLDVGNDAWAGYAKAAKTLDAAARLLGFTL
jgi:bifunctional non-homologous end joining protein LigD